MDGEDSRARLADALLDGDTRLFERLFSERADPFERGFHGYNGFDAAAATGNAEALERLAATWTPGAGVLTGALCSAAGWGSDAGCMAALSLGADVNGTCLFDGYGGVTPLMLALDSFHLETAELLISKGADCGAEAAVGREGRVVWTTVGALCKGMGREGEGVVRHRRAEKVLGLLMGAGGLGSAGFGRTIVPLAEAAEAGWQGGVELLLAGGVDVNERAARSGRTALMAAAGAGCGAGMVEVLLKAGADPSAVDAEGRTALMYAVSGGDWSWDLDGKRERLATLFAVSDAGARSLMGMDAMSYARSEGWDGAGDALAALMEGRELENAVAVARGRAGRPGL